MNDITDDQLTSDCPVCKTTRTYKTKSGYVKGLSKPCVSCSNSLKAGGSGAKYVDGGVKCSKCKQVLPEGNFYFKSGKPYSYCKVCHVGTSSKYYNEVDRYNRYGITKGDYDKMLEDQNEKCAGCSLVMDNPHIDHCHKSGQVRGLLCHSCNLALGLLKDSKETLKKLIKYLKGA